MKLLTCWCERLPDILVTRICCLLVRYVFDLLSSVPAEFIVTTRDSAIRLLHLALVKGYGIPIDTT